MCTRAGQRPIDDAAVEHGRARLVVLNAVDMEGVRARGVRGNDEIEIEARITKINGSGHQSRLRSNPLLTPDP